MHFPDIPGYQIQEEIGRGSMGVVYRARHLGLDRVVALKVLHAGPAHSPQLRKSFLQQAQVAAQLSHAHVAALVDSGWIEGPPPLCYLASQFIHGRTLHQLLAVKKPQPLECAEIVTQIASALDYAHAQGVIHGSVSPGNILVSPDGKAALTDWGLRDFTVAPTYLSPEQCRGAASTPKSDQYALATSLFELLTGQPPFLGVDPAVVRQQQISGAPPSLRKGRTDITPRMEAAVMRAMSKLPEMRFPTATDFAREFEAACRERPAADILVGGAPGPASQVGAAPVASAAPVSLIGGETFAPRSRGTHSGVVVSAQRSLHERRRKRSLALMLLLLVLCIGGGAAAYFRYFRAPAQATAGVKAKPAKKPSAKSKRRAESRSGRAGTRSSARPAPAAAKGKKAGPPSQAAQEVPTPAEEPATSAEDPAGGDPTGEEKPAEGATEKDADKNEGTGEE